MAGQEFARGPRQLGHATRSRGAGPHPPSPTRGDGEILGRADGGRKDRLWNISPQLHAQMAEVARRFRKAATPSEAMLWDALRGRSLRGRKFRRQQPIGPFVVDFYCPEERLIVEVEGPVHLRQAKADRDRQRLLESFGLRLLRLTAEMVETQLDRALGKIEAAFDHGSPARHPSRLTPSPLVGEGAGGEGNSRRRATRAQLTSPR